MLVTIRVGLLTQFTLQKLQIENSEFRQQLRQFTSGSSSSASSTGVAPTPSNPLEQHAKDFDNLGRLFCVLNEIWVHSSHLRKPYPEDLREIGPRHPARYSNDQAKHDGVIAELYDFVPPRFHKYLEGSIFFANKVRVALILQTVLMLVLPSSLLELIQ